MGSEELYQRLARGCLEDLTHLRDATRNRSWEPSAQLLTQLLHAAAGLAGALADMHEVWEVRSNRVCDKCDSVNSQHHAEHGCWIKAVPQAPCRTPDCDWMGDVTDRRYGYCPACQEKRRTNPV